MQYCHQTTFGMSERLVGAVVGVHGDDKGLVLPPAVAPFQVVIIPILAKGNVEAVAIEARKLAEELTSAGVRVKLDETNDRPGSKFYNWEIKGVPLRLELGMRDIEGGKVAFAKRNDAKKGSFARADCVKEVKVLLDSIMTEMLESAQKKMKDSYVTIASLDNIPGKTLRFGWCGDSECGHTLEQKTELKLLGTPYEQEEFHGKCIVCGKDTDKVAYASKAM